MQKLSILTVNLNNESGLRRTINSVINQTYSDFEYIIIDGGSYDGSLDVIEKYAKKITSWLSQSDRGIYHAMNKGIQKANGEYLLFLNSGDCLYSANVIEQIINNNLVEDIIAGDILIKENSNNENQILKKSPKKITAKYLFENYLPHPGTLIKRKLFNEIDLYNESYKIVSDWEFFLKAFLIYKATYRYLPICVSVFVADGISAKPEFANLIHNEKKNVITSNFPYIYQDLTDYVALEKKVEDYKSSLEFEAFSFLKKIRIVSLTTLIFKIITKITRTF